MYSVRLNPRGCTQDRATRRCILYLIGILDVMQEQLLEDLNYADLTDRGAEVLNSDYQRLSDIKKQLTLTMEVIKL